MTSTERVRILPERPTGSERRKRRRSLCSDLVELSFNDQTGRSFSQTVLLEDVSPTGACLQSSIPVATGASVRIRPRGRDLEVEAVVAYCKMLDDGYLLGLEYSAPAEGSGQGWRPAHLTAIED